MVFLVSCVMARIQLAVSTRHPSVHCHSRTRTNRMCTHPAVAQAFHLSRHHRGANLRHPQAMRALRRDRCSLQAASSPAGGRPRSQNRPRSIRASPCHCHPRRTACSATHASRPPVARAPFGRHHRCRIASSRIATSPDHRTSNMRGRVLSPASPPRPRPQSRPRGRPRAAAAIHTRCSTLAGARRRFRRSQRRSKTHSGTRLRHRPRRRLPAHSVSAVGRSIARIHHHRTRRR